ncbi:MAG: DinB family protein, partial [Chitinophagaceae bacterium]
MVENVERWLAGPINGVPALLQPVAHALLQAQHEIHALLFDFPPALFWSQPAGIASVGFHLQHIRGVLDRLFTYARSEA